MPEQLSPRRPARGLAAVVGGAFVGAALAACGGSSGSDARGIYDAQGCGGCHSSSALGGSGTSGPNLDGVAAAATTHGLSVDAFVRRALTDPNALGLRNMPSFASALSDAQVATLAAALGGGQTGSTGS